MVKNMIPYTFLALISVAIFAFVHLSAFLAKKLDTVTHGRLLSAGGGVAIAYVFVDLLPKLSKHDEIIRKALEHLFPYFERHVYVLALAGFLLFYVVDQSHTWINKKEHFWFSLSSYALFNFFVGYAVVDKDNPEVRPLVLFTFAMALHMFTNDYALSKDYKREYASIGKTILVLSLFLGWLVGSLFALPEAGVAMISAFIGGGVIMNVTRHEIPADNPHSLGSFLFFAVAYTIVLLSIG